MEDTARSKDAAVAVARFLEDHKAEDTIVLDLTGITTIADYFVISTARSRAHLSGLMRELPRFFHGIGVRPLGKHKRSVDIGWLLVDCGDVVVHVMNKEQRDFYELERLWFKAERVDYSSKSS
jgi:ribosome-associated protein